MSSTLAVVLPGRSAGAAGAGLRDLALGALSDAGIDEIVVLTAEDGDPRPGNPRTPGFETRPTDGSVAHALAVAADAGLRGGHDRILLHRLDHALTPATQITAVLQALERGAAVAVPVLPVTDTITAVTGSVFGRTIDRTGVRAVCSPWGFTAASLAAAAEAGSAESRSAEISAPNPGPDAHAVDAGLLRAGAAGAGGGPVAAVPGLPAGAFLGDDLSRRRLSLAHPDVSPLLPPLPALGADLGDDLGAEVEGAAPSGAPRAPSSRADDGAQAAAVVLAAGSGTRFGAPVNKAYLPLAGTTVLAHSLRRFAGLPGVGPVLLVIREDDRDRARRVVAEVGAPVEIVVGGATRQASEEAALHHLSDRIRDGSIDIVAIHDSARPLADERLCGRVLAAARRHGGAVPGVLRPELAVGTRNGTGLLPGATGPLVAVQTPQAFSAAVLVDAYDAARRAGFEGTDTASVVAAHSGAVARWVPAPATNLKITFAEDLPLAELLLAEQRSAAAGRGA